MSPRDIHLGMRVRINETSPHAALIGMEFEVSDLWPHCVVVRAPKPASEKRWAVVQAHELTPAARDEAAA